MVVNFSLFMESANIFSFYVAGFLISNVIGLAFVIFRMEMVRLI